MALDIHRLEAEASGLAVLPATAGRAPRVRFQRCCAAEVAVKCRRRLWWHEALGSAGFEPRRHQPDCSGRSVKCEVKCGPVLAGHALLELREWHATSMSLESGLQPATHSTAYFPWPDSGPQSPHHQRARA